MSIQRFLFDRCLVPIVAMCLAVPAFAAPFAYIPKGSISSVAVLDLATNTVVTNVAVGVGATGIATAPDNKHVYVVNQNSGTVSVIGTATNTVSATITVGTQPWSAVVSPDNKRLYVTNGTSNSVSVIDTNNNTVLTTIATTGPRPGGITISPNGSRLFVAFGNGLCGVDVIDTASNTQIASISISNAYPNGIAMSPDGQRVYVAEAGGNSIGVIDAIGLSVIGNVSLGSAVYPNGVVVSPDGSTIYATELSGSNVVFIDAATLTISATVAVGTRLYGIDVAPDGKHVYAVNFDSPATVNVIDTTTHAVTPVALGGNSNIWAIGRFIASVPALSAPNAPQLVSAVAGNAQATLNFTAPTSNGGSAITGYTASCGAITNTGTISPIIVGGLSNGTSYSCSVTATNAVGTSAASNSVNVIPVTVPDPPIITGIAAGDGLVTLMFTPPANTGGSTITGYNAFCGGFTYSSATSPIIAAGLPNGVPVSCTMNAMNAAGPSTSSLPSATVTPGVAPSISSAALPNGVYGQAYSYAVLASGSPSPTFSIGAGALPPGLTLDASSGLVSGVPSSVSSGAVTGLIQASNGIGTPAQQNFSITIAAALPDAPIIGNASAGNGTVTVQFTAPAQTGGVAISSYTATCGTQTNTGAFSPIIVSGLSNGIAVTCTVIATTTAGNSVASAPSNTVTPATVPDAPTITTITAGDSQAIVAFDAPLQNGGATITSYVANCTPGASSAGGAASPLTVTGLSNGVTYSCSITAINSAGTGATSASMPVTPRAPADLSITITHGSDFIAGGLPTTYTIVVSNLGTSSVTGAHVVDTLDTDFSLATWTCDNGGGGICPASSGTGEIDAMIDLPAGASITLQWTAIIAALPESPVNNMATVTVPNSFNDTNPGNNMATDGPDIRGIFRDGFD